MIELATIGSTIARIGLCVLKLFFEAGATQEFADENDVAAVRSDDSREKCGRRTVKEDGESDGDEEAEVDGVSSCVGFLSFMRERAPNSNWMETVLLCDEVSSLLDVMARVTEVKVNK